MINATFRVTFGIEVECILAFHETLLHKHLAITDTKTEIIKDIPDDIRRELCQVSQHYLDEDARRHDETRRKYMGWGLTTPMAYPPERDNIRFQEHSDKHLQKFGYRGYGGEVLHIAQTILPKGVEIHDSFNSEDKHTDFSHWHLAHERGLVGVDKKELAHQMDLVAKTKPSSNINNVLQPPTKIEEWDTHPLELVSRVLPYNSASIDEVHDHLTALQSGQTHFAFATKHCGLHVHVGLPVPHNHPAGTPPPTFTLPTLQHLAYIQVMYEAQISKLHPPSRGDGTNIDLKSNTDNFYSEPEPLTDAEYDALDARCALLPQRRRARRLRQDTTPPLHPQKRARENIRRKHDNRKTLRANGRTRPLPHRKLDIYSANTRPAPHNRIPPTRRHPLPPRHRPLDHLRHRPDPPS